MTFEEYLKKEDEEVKEDEMVAAAPSASDMVSGPKGTTAGDILGKCSHGSKGGFMSKDCNHIPKPLSLEPMKRTRKNKKQKVYLITDAELDRKTILSLHEVPEKTIAAFIQKAHMEKREIKVNAIVYYPVSKKFFAKVKCAGRVFFSVFDFDEAKKKFISTDEHRYTANEAKAKFDEILNMPGNSPANKGSEDMNLWIVWGKL